MEKWQIYLYLFFVVTILHALYDKRTKLAVGACAFFAIVVGAIKYATYGLYSGLLAFVLLLAPAAVGASMQKSGILNKVLDESDDNTEDAPPVPLASADEDFPNTAQESVNPERMVNYLDDNGQQVANTYQQCEPEKKTDDEAETGKKIIIYIVMFFLLVLQDVRLFAICVACFLLFFKRRNYFMDKRILWPQSLHLVKTFYYNILLIFKIWFYIMMLLIASVLVTNKLWWQPDYTFAFYAFAIAFPFFFGFLLVDISDLHDLWAIRYQAKPINNRTDKQRSNIDDYRNHPDYENYLAPTGLILLLFLFDSPYLALAMVLVGILILVQYTLWTSSKQAREE